MTGPRAAVAATVATTLAALVAVAGCTSSDLAIPRGTIPAPSGGVANIAPLGTPVSGASTQPAGPGCEPGMWVAIKEHIDNPAVALVGLADNCRKATIETTLDGSSTAPAIGICNAAAEVTYAMGVTAISVTAADASPLAAGTLNAPCAGVP